MTKHAQTPPQVAVALSAEALLGKSKAYIVRALSAKGRKELGEYQLWASLSLELLGKAALARVHPCLIADPTSQISMFAAAGLNIGTDIKTIVAKTLFDRLTHVSKRFDTKAKTFCVNLSLRRNAELHSGEMPFEAVIPSSWEGRFWHAVEIILESCNSTIEEWLGADKAQAPKAIISEYTHAIKASAKVKVEEAREAFMARTRKEREELQAKAAALDTWQMTRSFNDYVDEVWTTKCPACRSNSFVGGMKYHEEVSDDGEDDPFEETVNAFYAAEEFRCPACQLVLDNRDSIGAVGLSIDYDTTETRQREYEPDYGND